MEIISIIGNKKILCSLEIASKGGDGSGVKVGVIYGERESARERLRTIGKPLEKGGDGTRVTDWVVGMSLWRDRRRCVWLVGENGRNRWSR